MSKLLLNADKYCLITFSTTHNALRAEKVLNQEGIPILVVPTPREVSAGCGLAIRFLCEDFQAVKEKLNRNDIFVKSVYRVEKDEKQTLIVPYST